MSRNNSFGIACKTCRRRGRKCDRSLPTCTNCILRGVECEGYVLRWVKANVRGTLPGQASKTDEHVTDLHLGPEPRASSKAKTTPTRADGSESSPHTYYQTKLASKPELPEYHERDTELECFGTPDTDSQAVSILRRQNWSILEVVGTARDGLEGFVEYYARDISTAFFLGQGPAETPDIRHILPMARSIPSVRCAVAASAACHLANRLEDDQLKRQSLHLRLKATELLRAKLKSEGDLPDLACLASMLLLAQLDVCSGDCVEFGTHLKAASTFIKLRGSDGTERGFIEQRIAWLDIMGATTSSRMPHWSSEDVKATLNKFRTPTGREWGFDVFYCPIDLFEHIADITVLYKLQTDPRDLGQEAIQKAVILGNAVKNWDAFTDDSGPRHHMVEVWRLGILLYLIRLFQVPKHIFDTPHLKHSIFRHARGIPSRTSWSYSTPWPLFQAGLLLPQEDNDTKAWLRNELRTNFRSLGCIHQKLAVEALEQVWRSGEDGLYDLSDADFPQRKLIL
ncbi:hypothetical protein PV11_04675 [Exophiala sideris]|uniref:Zn(2)-C6 fungal-type domain-containing protein n=1 Tax=Exophiala sideris TaxID=1016849 RepID=A0A0D1YN67_9EURO|nr:hypothetical protein PV11_04675 [Exophiala sideris]